MVSTRRTRIPSASPVRAAAKPSQRSAFSKPGEKSETKKSDSNNGSKKKKAVSSRKKTPARTKSSSRARPANDENNELPGAENDDDDDDDDDNDDGFVITTSYSSSVAKPKAATAVRRRKKVDDDVDVNDGTPAKRGRSTTSRRNSVTVVKKKASASSSRKKSSSRARSPKKHSIPSASEIVKAAHERADAKFIAFHRDPRILKIREEEAAIKLMTIFNSPVAITLAFFRAVFANITLALHWLRKNPAILYSIISFCLAIAAVHIFVLPGTDENIAISVVFNNSSSEGASSFDLRQVVATVVRYLESEAWFAIYWIGLGVASSIGLGTGLHTFLLYLGPHIAVATITAYSCKSLDFDTRLPKSAWVCPEASGDGADGGYVRFLDIVAKVAPEAFLWGFGTAIGELPPYFVARAARLAGQKIEDLDDVGPTDGDALMDRAKRWVLESMERVGFIGVLLMAAIPNPLFDLAGLTCGHLLFPFWKFFGATMIGKAVIKSQIQTFFVVGICSDFVLDGGLKMVASVAPAIAETLRKKFAAAKDEFTMHAASNGDPTKIVEKPVGWVAFAWDWTIKIIIALFVISLVNSLARDCLLEEKEKETKAVMDELEKSDDDSDDFDLDVVEITSSTNN